MFRQRLAGARIPDASERTASLGVQPLDDFHVHFKRRVLEDLARRRGFRVHDRLGFLIGHELRLHFLERAHAGGPAVLEEDDVIAEFRQTGALISPLRFIAKAAVENAPSIVLASKNPSSPPFLAAVGSSEYSRASFAKSSPASAFARTSSALAKAAALLPSLIVTRMCAARTCSG